MQGKTSLTRDQYERRLTCKRCATVVTLFEASMIPADRHEISEPLSFVCYRCLTGEKD